jgi:hypothetical protein
MAVDADRTGATMCADSSLLADGLDEFDIARNR